MSIAEKFCIWWHANWNSLTGSVAFAAYRAGYEQGYADALRERK